MDNINNATQFGGENSGNMTKDAQRTEIRSPVKAIRAYCLNCGDGTAHEVRRCDRKKCPLWAFRFGKNPYLHREISEEQKQKAAQRLRELAAARKAE